MREMMMSSPPPPPSDGSPPPAKSPSTSPPSKESSVPPANSIPAASSQAKKSSSSIAPSPGDSGGSPPDDGFSVPQNLSFHGDESSSSSSPTSSASNAGSPPPSKSPPPPKSPRLPSPPPSPPTTSPPPVGWSPPPPQKLKASGPSPSPQPGDHSYTPPPNPASGSANQSPPLWQLQTSLQGAPPTPPQAYPPPDSRANGQPPLSEFKSPPPFQKSSSSSPPPGQRITTPSPPHSSSKTEASTKDANSSTGSNGTSTTVIGAAVTATVVSALIIIAFIFLRRKRRHQNFRDSEYKPSPGSRKSGGIYNEKSFVSNSELHTPCSSSPLVSTYGSQIGNTYVGGGPDSGVISTSKTIFSYEELMEITNGFSRQNVLGEGGFGSVYKGWLSEGRAVAVKLLKAGSGQGDREFRAEVEIISRVHHRHLVSLVGYCISEGHRLLIYEFVPNKTLEHHLHGQGMPVLEWSKRLKISLGAAKGLAYLHEDCYPKIIHRDIKSANILLDDAFEAQVADFGLAKFTNDAHTHVSTRVMGTFGYMAPEYASSGKLTDRSDVFSFGVVLLELITGRKSVDQSQPMGDESLVEWARPLLIDALETGEVGQLIDPRLEKHYVESEVLRMIEVAAACVRHSAPKRPRMVQVVRALDMETENCHLSNGVKYGQSTAYDSGMYNEDIRRLRMMASESGDYTDNEFCSGEFYSREASGPLVKWNS